jgi:hypothetical protein
MNGRRTEDQDWHRSGDGDAHSHDLTRKAVGIFCSLIGVVSIVFSVSLNAAFYSNLGRTYHEAVVFGGVAGVVDVAKGILPVVIAHLRHAGKHGRVIASWFAFGVFTLASFIATLGFFAINRSSTIGEQAVRGAIFADWRRELDDVEREHRSILERRSAGEFDLAVAQALAELVTDKRGRARRLGDLSDGCAKPDLETRDACNAVMALRRQRATAERRSALEARLADLRSKVERGTNHAGFTDGDPQVRSLSELTTLKEKTVLSGGCSR